MKTLSLRSQFHAPKNHLLVQWDLSQAETWIVAYLADETRMKRSLHDGDIHADTAGNALFHCNLDEVTKVMRYTGKRYNHASSYRMGAKKAMEVINADSDKPPFLVVSLAESKEFSTNWHNYYNVKNWWREIEEQLVRNKTLITVYGRIRYFFDHLDEATYRKATAYNPQSTVSDHMKGLVHPKLGVEGGTLTVKREFQDKKKLIKVIQEAHDSLVVEVHKDNLDDVTIPIANLLRRPLVINGEEFTIPVECEIGERMGEMKEVKV